MTAQNEDLARQKVQDHYNGGRAGDAYVDFKNAKGFAKLAEGGDLSESISVDDAWEND